MGYVSTWMGDRLSSRSAVGSVSVGIFLCPQISVNSSALLMSLMALHSREGTKIPFGLVSFVVTYFHNTLYNYNFLSE